ncbi:MAG: hypothetical protein QOE11_262 [Solirubrobacteraceae bacterium]|jgi:hypothetical protein|nr:hypothetical protein [Solirubrobacteraceae bacterium]
MTADGARTWPAGALVAGALLASAATPAQARVACGTEKAASSGQIFHVVAGGVGCGRALTVAGGWFALTSTGRPGRAVLDGSHKRWGCRVTQRATGTDPGLQPFTSIRCTRRGAVVRFQQRS